MTKPITPTEAKKRAGEGIPAAVFEVFNALLRARYNANGIRVTQEAVVKMLTARMPEVERQHIYDQGWLDIEEAYRQAGWSVTYDKPLFNESGEAFWVFMPETTR